MSSPKKEKISVYVPLRNLAAEVYGQAPRKWRPGLLQELRDELDKMIPVREKGNGKERM